MAFSALPCLACFLNIAFLLSERANTQPLSSQITVLLRSPAEYGYTAEVQIAENQTFEVMVDTGSPLFAVSANGNLGGPFYKGSCDGPEVSFQYGGGSGFSGHACNNVDLNLGGVGIGQPWFVGMNRTTSGGQAIRYGGFNLSGTMVQGILGLAYARQAQYTNSTIFSAYVLLTSGCTSTQNDELVVNCSKSDLCKVLCDRQSGAINSALFYPLEYDVFKSLNLQRVFSMQCCGTYQEGITGKLIFGDVDHTLYRGKMAYTPIILEGFYFLNVTRLGTNASNMVPYMTPELMPMDARVPLPLSVGAINYFMYQQSSFYVDSGNPYLGLGSAETFMVVQDSINAAAANLGLGPVILPLHSASLPACVKPKHLVNFPDILLEAEGGLTLRIPPASYLKPQRRYPDCLWPFVTSDLHVLGLPVLETYYTVYDQEQRRLGFAPVANCNGKEVILESSINV